MTIHFPELDAYGQRIASLSHEPLKITATMLIRCIVFMLLFRGR
jgi:hypothetical protein